MMYPAGWPDEIEYEGSVYTYSGRREHILSALASSQSATKTEHWLGVLAYPMNEAGRERVVNDLYDRAHPLTGLGMWVLTDRICQDALGMQLFSAGKLAATALHLWLPFNAWAVKQGLALANLQIHELLSAAYGWQANACGDEKALEMLNLGIFGKRNPWG